MCDTLSVTVPGRTLFAKSSDRPAHEVQVVEPYPARPGGGRVHTQYLELDDPGAAALLGSRPAWLWGFEHGVNEHRVAIGNEAVYTVDDPRAAPPALIGMDLVRLGLERATTADGAVDVITSLIERHGQGGVTAEGSDDSYWSSFLVADPGGAWVVETSGRTWAAEPVAGAAISNRLSLRTGWTRSSADVPPGADFDRWRDPAAATPMADLRLAATRPAVAALAEAPTPGALVAVLRHHGDRPWGAPGSDPFDVSPPPAELLPDFTGISVCMHVRALLATTSSMVAELPEDPGAPLRAWVALGSPCTSVFVPVFPPEHVPAALAEPATWHRFATLRDRVEAEPGALTGVRAVLGPVETDLWEEADAAAADASDREAFAARAWDAVDTALRRLGV